MTRKDYIVIAKAIKNAQDSYCAEDLQAAKPEAFEAFLQCIVDNIAMALSRDNPRFDSGQFWSKCGIKE